MDVQDIQDKWIDPLSNLVTTHPLVICAPSVIPAQAGISEKNVPKGHVMLKALIC